MLLLVTGCGAHAQDPTTCPTAPAAIAKAPAPLLVDESVDCPAVAPSIEQACGPRPPDAGLTTYALCEHDNGHFTPALKDAQLALKAAIGNKDVESIKASRQLVVGILAEMPKVTFDAPSDAQVMFDDRPVPNESFAKKFSVEPGLHIVRSNGSVIGNYCVRPRQLRTIRVATR